MSELEPEIKVYCPVTEDAKKDFDIVMQESDGYEPFFDKDTPIYIAYVDGAPVGILTYVILKEDAGIPHEVTHLLPDNQAEQSTAGEAPEITNFEAEFTVFVKKEFRQQKIATKLINKAKEDLEAKYENLKVIISLPETLLRSSLASVPAYAEMLLRLGREKFLQAINSPKVRGITKDVESQTTVNRSEDGKTYTLSQGDKEVASVKLDFEPNATSLFNIFVEPLYRNRGFGTTLVAKVLNDVFSKKDKPVVLNVKSTNKAAVNLYENVGFDEVERLWYFRV